MSLWPCVEGVHLTQRRYWGQQIHGQAIQVLSFYLFTVYGLLTVGTYEYVKDTTDAKNADHVFRFGSATKRCVIWKRRGVYPTGLLFYVLSPPFSICTCHCNVYWCSYVEGVLYSLPHVILIATYKLPNLEDEPAFSWKKKKSSQHSFLPRLQHMGSIYLSCLHKCLYVGCLF